MAALQKLTQDAGRPFDMVLDTVSSHSNIDSAFQYEHRIRNSNPPIVATGPGADPHNYVTIGAQVLTWRVGTLWSE